MDFPGLEKSLIRAATDFSLGVIKYTASKVANGSRFFCKSSTTIKQSCSYYYLCTIKHLRFTTICKIDTY